MTDYDKHGDIYSRWSIKETPYSALEWHTFLSVLGPVTDLSVLDVACGDGRLSRALMDLGAKSVLGTDISQDMITAAIQKNQPNGAFYFEALDYQVIDARNPSFTLPEPVDLVTAMYLFHYASSTTDLDAMCHFAGRNLRPGGRFVCYTINPDYDFGRQDPRMAEMFGFRYEPISPPEYHLVIGDFEASIWHWSREAHEEGLRAAGFEQIQWHSLALPDDKRDLAAALQWYLDNPSLIVLSAQKTSG